VAAAPKPGVTQEGAQIPRAELRILQSAWGHVAREGLNAADTAVIEQAITDLLGR